MRRLVCSLGEMGGAASSICYLPSIRPLETAQFYLEHLLKRKFATSRPIDEGRTGIGRRLTDLHQTGRGVAPARPSGIAQLLLLIFA